MVALVVGGHILMDHLVLVIMVLTADQVVVVKLIPVPLEVIVLEQEILHQLVRLKEMQEQMV